jgi:S1-C subfamily serine protease
MMLTHTYKSVKRSVIAFMPKYEQANQHSMPIGPILGTGFVIGENGLVATNHHVIELLEETKTPSSHNPKVACYHVVAFALREHGLATVALEVLKVVTPAEFTPEGVWYGPDKPDIAIVQVMAKNLPALRLDEGTHIEEGMEVATAGFPMGRNALLEDGRLDQIGPTLQVGIISAVLPFPGKSPHGFTVNVMAQGGVSGSPVFLPETGAVVGILYAGLDDSDRTEREEPLSDNGHEHRHSHVVPTNISYAIPTWLLGSLLASIETENDLTLPQKTKSFDEIVEDVVNDSEKPNR